MVEVDIPISQSNPLKSLYTHISVGMRLYCQCQDQFDYLKEEVRIQDENEHLIESDEMLINSISQGGSVFIVTIDSTFFVSLDWSDGTVVLCVPGRSTVREIVNVRVLFLEIVIGRLWKERSSILQKLNMRDVNCVIWILQNLCFIIISDRFKGRVIFPKV